MIWRGKAELPTLVLNRMENSARLAGYTLAFIALTGLMAIVAFLEDGSLFARTMVKVGFPNSGTLMEDDPVKIRGVEVGRVESIDPGPHGPIVTLELYKKTTLPRDSRFINYNYSLFGARMVVLVPGKSPEPMNIRAVQAGHFSTGVTETIHRVDRLLRTVTEYQTLAGRLEKGDGTALSFQQLLSTRIYPALDEFTAFAEKLEVLEGRASSDLEGLARASGQVRGFSEAMNSGTDTLIGTANRTVERLVTLTAQTTLILEGLEKIMLAAQDTGGLPHQLLARRDLYEKTLTLSHALHDLLDQVKRQGLKDIIHFWRNVKIRKRDP